MDNSRYGIIATWNRNTCRDVHNPLDKDETGIKKEGRSDSLHRAIDRNVGITCLEYQQDATQNRSDDENMKNVILSTRSLKDVMFL